MLSRAHNLDAATKQLVESVTPQHSHSKDTRGSLLSTSGKLPILGFRFPYVRHLDLSLSPSLKRLAASCCQVDYCEVEYLHHEDCSAAVLSKAMDHGYILAELCHAVVSHNAQEQVTWIHSYVSQDKQKTWCIYDGPSPEAIRQAARRSHLPIDRITEGRVLDPYFYI